MGNFDEEIKNRLKGLMYYLVELLFVEVVFNEIINKIRCLSISKIYFLLIISLILKLLMFFVHVASFHVTKKSIR